MVDDLVPTVDVSSWADGTESERDEIAALVDEACSRIGFMQIVGHGMADGVIADMLTATDAFFALPLEEKLRWRSPDPSINRGYAAEGTEGLSYSVGMESPPDLFEALNIGEDEIPADDPWYAADPIKAFAPNIWPDDPSDLRRALVTYFAAARGVALTLTDVFGAALGLGAGWFRPYVSRSTNTLRRNHYERRPGSPAPLPDQQRMGAHTDYGIVTVLYADPVPGLQIVGPDGGWHDVQPTPGGFLVNLGDLTATWTNDRWRSTLHRVVPPPADVDGSALRRSVAFFFDGDYDARVECLPTCTGAENPPRYPTVTAGEHLMAKLLGPRTLTTSDAMSTAGDRLG